MEEHKDQVIEETVDKIVELFSPSKVIEYNTKYDMDGHLISFKLCIVGNIPDNDEVGSEIPYDIILYTDEEFKELSEQLSAFANRISQKGRVRYGR